MEDSEELLGRRILEADRRLLAPHTCRGHGGPEGGILCVPAGQEYAGSLSHWGEGREVQGRSAPRALHIMSSFRSALLHCGQRNRYGCPSCVGGCRGRGEKDWGDGGRQGVGEWCGVMRMCLAGWRFGKLSPFPALLPGPL